MVSHGNWSMTLYIQDIYKHMSATPGAFSTALLDPPRCICPSLQNTYLSAFMIVSILTNAVCRDNHWSLSLSLSPLSSFTHFDPAFRQNVTSLACPGEVNTMISCNGLSLLSFLKLIPSMYGLNPNILVMPLLPPCYTKELSCCPRHRLYSYTCQEDTLYRTVQWFPNGHAWILFITLHNCPKYMQSFMTFNEAQDLLSFFMNRAWVVGLLGMLFLSIPRNAFPMVKYRLTFYASTSL